MAGCQVFCKLFTVLGTKSKTMFLFSMKPVRYVRQANLSKPISAILFISVNVYSTEDEAVTEGMGLSLWTGVKMAE